MQMNSLPIIKSKYKDTALTEEMLKTLMKKTELAIIEEKEKQSKILPELKEAQTMYQLVKDQYDSHQIVIDKEEQILAALVAMQTKSPDREVFHRVSNTLQKAPKEKKRQTPIPWQSLMQEILKQKNHFIKLDTLYNMALDLPEVRERKLEEKQKRNTLYYIKEKITIFKNLKMHNKKVGLITWFNDNGELKPEYLKDFMG